MSQPNRIKHGPDVMGIAPQKKSRVNSNKTLPNAPRIAWNKPKDGKPRDKQQQTTVQNNSVPFWKKAIKAIGILAAIVIGIILFRVKPPLPSLNISRNPMHNDKEPQNSI